jgi:hypothetical protein
LARFSWLKGRRPLAPLLLSAWLILSGLAQLIDLHFAFMGVILGALALAAGVLILIDR